MTASGAAGHQAIARVVLVPSPGRLAALDYRLPAEHAGARAGMRVLVPLGASRRMGVIIEVTTEAMPREGLRDVFTLLDATPVLDGSLLRVVQWMADYYLVPLGDAVAAALPGALRIETERVLVAQPGIGDAGQFKGMDRELFLALQGDTAVTVAALCQRLGPKVRGAIRRLQRQGVVRVSERLRREVAPTRTSRFYEVAERVGDDDARLARRPASCQLYQYLRDHPLRRASAHELRASFANADAKLRALRAAGLIRFKEEEHYRNVLPPVTSPDHKVTLTAAQRDAVGQIAAAAGFVPFLLWGVTGSGKTEVYLRAVAAALTAGRTALILVPEISLTHQLVDRVRARFGDRVAVLHSQLNTGERWDQWRRIARGEAIIVIGARSAVFAPLRRLGIIIVDEEHDPAYKQAEGVHYQARDVAVMRAKLAACTMVLGSATPSMESFFNAQAGRYRLVRLPERVEARPLPDVEMVDLRSPRSSKPTLLSPSLAAALEANLAVGGQSLLFLNRRGFANFLQCRACGDPVMCPNCSVALTLHRQWRALRCHYCDHTVAQPTRCGSCNESALEGWGVGTEQLEARLRAAFPAARIGRMDRDTTRRKGSQLSLLGAWAGGSLDMLIGTQMVAKGHDVPGVTLVGVLLADSSLNFPDFRAAERTFQLLAQVAGRAGRGERRGRVFVQTLQPDHYSLQAVVEHDFAGFAERELAARREVGYPPFARLILLRVEGERLADVEQLAEWIARQLRERSRGRFVVLGPAPAPLQRLRQRHRRQILVRGGNSSVMRRSLAELLEPARSRARARKVRLVADVDPYNML